jgi:SAM-dependent methyltransferase
MLGRRTADLESSQGRWIYRLWGCPDINTRQKWRAVWPYLERLKGSLSILDAGCGNGRWTLEIAARRPDWIITGVDRDDASIEQAKRNAALLGCTNVSFIAKDFLEFEPENTFDAILSVASAHYLVESGHGERLFECFRQWLSPGGVLVLLGPRRHQEVPQIRALPSLPAHRVFGRADLELLCHSAKLNCESIRPLIGDCGTLAKQLASRCKSRFGRIGAYPVELLLDAADRLGRRRDGYSAAWLMVARSGPKSAPLVHSR